MQIKSVNSKKSNFMLVLLSNADFDLFRVLLGRIPWVTVLDE